MRTLTAKKLTLLALSVAIILPTLSFAAPLTPGPYTQKLVDLIDKTGLWIVGLMLSVSVILMIYAAYLYLFSGMEPGNLKLAKSIITYIIIALVVALLSRLILFVINQVLISG